MQPARLNSSKPETPDGFTGMVAEALRSPGTHVYFDTSFLLWLTTIGSTARSEFRCWADTLADRMHVPLWSMHEYHRHQRGNASKAKLAARADAMIKAAEDFRREVRRYTDLPFLRGQPEAAFQSAVADAVEQLRGVAEVARDFDHAPAAQEIMDWIGERLCGSRSVFESMSSLRAKGAARYDQDLPPGFLDRRKKGATDKGSNKYGDILFWEEVMAHAKKKRASKVVVITRDRKRDWFDIVDESKFEEEWKRLRAKWLPVPQPHPTLAFELKIDSGADLVLLDELYLGALLWKFERPRFERLAAVAIDVTPDRFETTRPASRTIADRAAKRREQPTIGITAAVAMLETALNEPGERVERLLSELDRDAPDVEAFVGQFDARTVEELKPDEIALFCRLLHDRSKIGPGPAQTLVAKLIGMLDGLPADIAAAAYLGFLCSAYLKGQIPLARPDSPFLEDMLEWEPDTALERVTRVFARHLKRLRSPALYHPGAGSGNLTLRFSHDADQRQDPVVLSQVHLGGRALLRDGGLRTDLLLRRAVGQTEASVSEIALAIRQHFGLPGWKTHIEGAEQTDRRLIPDLFEFEEFDRFEPDDAPAVPNVAVEQTDGTTVADETVHEDDEGASWEDDE